MANSAALDNIFEIVRKDGSIAIHYEPTPKQLEFHNSSIPNLILEGTRGTGKSLAMRMDAHMRALTYPGFTYLIVRRTLGELRKTHLKFIGVEMDGMGGRFNKSEFQAYYPNGSLGFFSHCETPEDMEKLLGGEYHAVYFDEMTTFTPEQITKISTCARVPKNSGLIARVRGGTNPIGVGAEHVLQYFITKDVDPLVDQEYDPADYAAIHTILDDNPHIDAAQYRKKFGSLPEHVRRAWLDGEWVVEGAYFSDFSPAKHVIREMPTWEVEPGAHVPITQIPWIHWYRVNDWGWSPDPAVCLWLAVLPNSRAIVMRERSWRETSAKVVASEIKVNSKLSFGDMRVVESYADPTMFGGSGATDLHSIADIYIANGVPLSPSKNDRSAIGFAIHEWLNTTLSDGKPRLQFYLPQQENGWGCPQLLKTLPLMRTDKHNPTRIADGNDHFVISLGYFCLGRIGVPQSAATAMQDVPLWMRPKRSRSFVLGAESVR